MAKTELKVSDPKALIGISLFLVLMGGMVIDPALGFTCFAVAGILLLITGVKGERWTRYIAFFLLIISIALTVITYPRTSEHLRAYKSKAVK